MLNIFLITTQENNMLLGITIIVCMVVVAYLVRLFLRKKGERDFLALTSELAERVKNAQKEIDALLVPTHLVSEEEIKRLVTDNQSLIVDIDALEGHKYYDEIIFYETGIEEYRKVISDVNRRAEENNKIYNGIKYLNDKASNIVEGYDILNHPNHYFAYSEMEHFSETFDEIRDKVDEVFPKYAEYVKDEATRLLPELIKDLEEKRTEHNKEFVRSELEACKDYFDHVLGKYPLDPQQRDSIVKLEDNCLVIASAGSGKTSTIMGKAKYLVEKRNIAPSKILLLTYTKKAAIELEERMQIRGINSGTFHSLAYHIIAEVTGQAPSICDADVPLNVFRKLIVEDENFLNAIDTYIINLQSLMKLEHEYIDAFSYFEDRKKYGIQALFPDADGKIIFTRSEEEKRICSILTRLGVWFRYEHPYHINTVTPEHRQYKPDFTIYYKKEGSDEWQRAYLEHYAIDGNGQTPRWFGESTKGGWKAAQNKYLEGIEWKKETHRKNGTILLETTSADFHAGIVEQKIVEQLTEYGIPINRRTDRQLYDMLIKRNRQLEKTVFTLLLSFITLMKANEKTIEGLLKTLAPEDNPLQTFTEKRNRYVLTKVVKPFYEAYQTELDKNYEIDFTDAIIHATKLCREGLWKSYDYILVDEFQDISVDRYKLLQALRSDKPRTKLYCVGDDWQSIFRFAGSDIDLFSDFEKYFGYTEICKIETTYRFHQPLINKSSAFIMKNPSQREKTIKTPEGDTKRTYLQFVGCESDDNGTLKKAEEIVRSIPLDEDILFVGRYNYDAMSVGFKGNIEMNDNRMKVNIAGRDIFFLSVHSAKGLEADNVILVNCNEGAYGFPSLIEDDPILDFVLSKSEQFPFAEERRLFYVAMTRAKKKMFVLYDNQRPSPFIGEFLLKIEIGSYLCPKCFEGKIVPFKEGVASNGTPYRSYKCNNSEAGCDFIETKFGNLSSPGILITEDMNAQDVEKMRERRRKGLAVTQTNATTVSAQQVQYYSRKFIKR